MTPHKTPIWPAFFVILLGLLLSACGGGSSSDKTSQVEAEPEPEPVKQDQWVKGYAVKGAIEDGLVSLWYREPRATESSWKQVGNAVRTNRSGGFSVEVPDAYSGKLLKVILQSDTQTLMRCDVQPVCKTPSQVNVGFGEWFWPGNNIVLKSLFDPSDANRVVALTPLTTLVFEKFLQSPGGGFPYFKALLGSQEERFGLEAGALSKRPIDLAASDLSGVHASDLKTALLNVAFLSLVDGERWRTLGHVLEAAKATSEPNGDLPVSAGDTLNMSVELLALAGMLQAERSQEFFRAAGVQDSVQHTVLAGLEETLLSTGYNDTPQPEPTPEPVVPAPQPEPEPTPELVVPAPQPEPTPEPVVPAPQPQPQPITGSAKMTWQAPLTRANGESLAMGEIDKYIIRYGTEVSVDEMSHEVVVEDGQVMEYEVAELGEGVWHFAIQTVDTSGLKSEWSDSASKTIARSF